MWGSFLFTALSKARSSRKFTQVIATSFSS
jgi:hypothetical protein